MSKWMFVFIFVFISVVLSLYLTSAGWAAQCGPVYGADGIAVDSKGAVWITHYEDVRVGKLQPESSEFTEFLPTTKANPDVTTRVKGSSKEGFDYSFDRGFSGIAVDEKNGFLWTTRFNSKEVIRFSLKDREFKEFSLPGSIYGGRGHKNMDTEGNIWVLIASVDPLETKVKNGRVVMVSPEGKIKEFHTPLKEFVAWSMTLDYRGRPWLAITPVEKGKDAQLYVLNKGKWQRQKLPEVGRYITGMTFDSQGNLWFTAFEKNAIGKFSSGKVTFYPIPTPKASPNQIVIDKKGDIWFTEWHGNKIGRLSPDGQIREYPIPPEEESPITLAIGKDGHIWFSVLHNYNLFRLDPETGAIKEYTVPAPSNWSQDAAMASLTCSVKSKDIEAQEVKADPLIPLRHPVNHPEDTGAVLFTKSCNTQCHTWYRVDKVANRRTDWTPTVDRMIEANGAKFITEADREEILRYLNDNYTMKKGAKR